MNKWLVFLCALLCGLSVILISANAILKQKKEEAIKEQEKEEKQTIEYKANQTIRVRMTKTGEIIAMDINDYLRGVVPSEMPPSYHIEALKAQAIVARTYTYRKMNEGAEGPDADICDSYNHCQAYYSKEQLFNIWKNRGYDENTIKEYWDRVNEAVVSTQNKVIVYDGEYIKAFFHASSPIKTESVDQIWGGVEIPYLRSVENYEYEDYPNRNSEVFIDFSKLESTICEQVDRNFKLYETRSLGENIKINSYTTSGRVKDVKICNLLISAEKLRTLFGLKSTNFELCVQDNGLLFKVIGYGHGVGMSQVGANYLAAAQGKICEDIIKYYYTGVDVITLN